MNKKIIQDIIAKKTTSFTPKPEVKVDIPLKVERVNPIPEKSIDKISQNPFFQKKEIVPTAEVSFPPEWSEKKSSNRAKKFFKLLLVLAIFASVFLVAVKIVSVFSTVSFKITPKQKTIEIKKALTATSRSETDSLYFEIAEINHEGVKSVSGSAEKILQQKATGIVVIFNNNTKSQTLVKETRLESLDGKIYKTEKSLTIPAEGSAEVNVFADQPGKEYNVGLTDFKLPGFKGNAKYETVFGRSKTEITGGYVGQASVLSDTDFNNAKTDLRAEITQYLKDSIEKNTPAGFLAYSGSIKIEFATSTVNPRVGELNKKFEIKELAKAKVYLLRKDELEQKIINAYAEKLTPANPHGFTIPNINKLNFTLRGASADDSSIEFIVSGPAIFSWNVSKDQLINDLKGVSSTKYKEVLNRHSEIGSAEIVFNPSFWKIIPKDESRIKYEEIEPN